MSRLYIQDRDGSYAVASDEEVVYEAKRVLNRKSRKGSALITSPEKTREFLSIQLADMEHEVFSVLFLDNRHRVIAFEQLFRGTLDGASVHPREVVKRALNLNAAAVVFAHNHPSGNPEPSQADQRLTRRLVDALQLIDVRVLDHVVVGVEGAVSFAERGLI